MALKKDLASATIIVNPVSGKGDPSERRTLIKKSARTNGWKGTYRETTKTITAQQIAQEEVKKGVNHLIVCGGDGTIMEVLDVVANQKISLGIVPLGTGNLLARNLQLPLTIEDAMEKIFSGKSRTIDLGQANGIYYSIAAGIGLDADVMKAAERELKDRWGMLAYIVSAIKYLYNRSSQYEIRLDSKKPFRVKAKTIMVSNMGKVFNDIEIVPNTHAQSGTLQIGIVTAKSLPSWFNIVFHALIGKVHNSPHYDMYTAKKIDIHVLGKKRRFQCDGNSFEPVDRLLIKVCPKALTIME